MATNVTGMTPSVQAPERAQEAKGEKISVRRDGGSGAGFTPRTDVNIRNSISNMAEVLSKISSQTTDAENAIPNQLKEIINNIMRSAFSLESTVSEGVGSSLASQKFSVEQLNTLSRMMHHLGYLADQGTLGELSEDLQVVFDNLKTVLTKDSNMEAVNLNKLAFQFIQDENNPQVAKQLEQILSQLVTITGSQVGANTTVNTPSEGFSLLNKLVDAFFPKTLFTATSTGSEQSQAGTAQMANAQPMNNFTGNAFVTNNNASTLMANANANANPAANTTAQPNTQAAGSNAAVVMSEGEALSGQASGNQQTNQPANSAQTASPGQQAANTTTQEGIIGSKATPQNINGQSNAQPSNGNSVANNVTNNTTGQGSTNNSNMATVSGQVNNSNTATINTQGNNPGMSATNSQGNNAANTGNISTNNPIPMAEEGPLSPDALKDLPESFLNRDGGRSTSAGRSVSENPNIRLNNNTQGNNPGMSATNSQGNNAANTGNISTNNPIPMAEEGPLSPDALKDLPESFLNRDGGRSTSADRSVSENPNIRLNNAGMAYEGTASRHSLAEGENNPLFKQIFSRFGQQTAITNNNSTSNANQPPPVQLDGQQVATALKEAGQLLLKNIELSPKDVELLNNFINRTQGNLSEQDAKQLTMLLRTIQSNIPASVQQAGQRPGMEELPKLWAFMQLCDIGRLKKMKGYSYRSASKEINNFVNSMRGSMNSEGSYKADGQKSISFMMPLYMGDGTTQSYPAYVHIYDEPAHEDEKGIMRKDTWFRVCVLTESIGAVDIVCRLYEGNNLNLRVIFSDQDSVTEFSDYLPDIRKALYNTPINLTDLKIGTVNNVQ